VLERVGSSVFLALLAREDVTRGGDAWGAASSGSWITSRQGCTLALLKTSSSKNFRPCGRLRAAASSTGYRVHLHLVCVVGGVTCRQKPGRRVGVGAAAHLLMQLDSRSKDNIHLGRTFLGLLLVASPQSGHRATHWGAVELIG